MTFKKMRRCTFTMMYESDRLYPSFQLKHINENFSVYRHLSLNLLKVVFHSYKTICIEDARNIEKTVLQNAVQKKDILGITMPSVGASIDSSARTYFANCDLSLKYTKAMAVNVRSATHRMLLNFYLQFNRPPTKHRAFDELEKAILWIKEVNER